MKKFIFLVLLFSLFAFLGISQNTTKATKQTQGTQTITKKIHIPPQVESVINPIFLSKKGNNLYSFKEIKTFFFPSADGKSFLIYLFNAQIPEYKRTINIPQYPKGKDGKPDKTKKPTLVQKEVKVPFHFYIKLKNQTTGEVVEYNSPMPEGVVNFYSFTMPLAPGKFSGVIAISPLDFATDKIATHYFETTVPDFAAESKKLTYTEPMFIKSLHPYNSQQLVFTVMKNTFLMGRALVDAILTNTFSKTDVPRLVMYLLGTKKDSKTGKPLVEMDFKIKNHRGKDVAKYKPIKLQRNIIVQPLSFKSLKSGNYSIVLKVKDLIGKKKTEIKIPFTLK